MTSHHQHTCRGQVLIMTIVFMAIFLTVFVGFVNYMTLYARTERATVAQVQAIAIAEAGIDKAIYQLNQNANYGGETNTSLGNGTFTTSVSSVDSNTKRISVTGYVPNSTNPVAERTVKASANIDVSVVSFRYGVQVGEGGITMDNNSQVNGNMYSNGDISGSGTITGDATVAGGTQPTTDQQWTVQNSSYNLGDVSARADLAQSFKPATTTTLNRVSLYLKKVGVPSDITIKIVTDNSGKPSKTVLATGSISASTITSAYSFADAALATPPNLTTGTTYWIIAIATVNASNYYTWGDDTADAYTNGTGKYSTNWNASSPVWTTIGADLDFQTYMGGTITSLDGITVNGNAWAHSLTNCTVGGNATYQSISSCGVSGTSIPINTDPSPAPMPISDAQIAEWESTATAGGVLAGPYTINGSQTLGPIKINGDLTVNGTLNISGPIWVNGNITLSNNSHVNVSAGLGNNGAVLIADKPSSPSTSGKIILSNNVVVAGNGNVGSYALLISMHTGVADTAINASNNVASVIIYAPHGKIDVNNNATANEITAYLLHLDNNATVNYVSGLQNASFSNGPGGSWTYMHGSYVIVN